MIKFVGVDAHIDPQNNNNGPMWASARTIKSIIQTTIYQLNNNNKEIILKKTIKFLTILIIFLLLYFVLFKVLEIDKVTMKKIYPLKYSQYVEKYAREYNVDKYLVYAIIKAESNFKADAKSESNAIGLMQIMEATALETANKIDLNITEEDLFNPEVNIKIGLEYFTSLLGKYKNNYNLAIIAYNAGIGNVDKWIQDGIIKEDASDIENVPFKETNNYVRKILRDYDIYKDLYEK